MDAPTVLVCDDAPGFRLLIETVLADAGLEVVGTAESFVEAARLAAELRPTVVLLDLWLPQFDPDGVIAVRRAAPDARLAVLTSLAAEEAERLVADIDGIDAILSKREAPDALAARVLALARDEPPTAIA